MARLTVPMTCMRSMKIACQWGSEVEEMEVVEVVEVKVGLAAEDFLAGETRY